MRLLWKLLRQHISISQFSGFLFANLFGMIIVLAGYQFYNDVLPVFTSGDSFMKANYLMVTKRIGTGNTLSGRISTFSGKEMAELQNQSFVNKLGGFTSTNYKTNARMGINGQQILNTEMYFESVPDEFVDIDKTVWHYEEGSEIIPIIMPRTYINMYNFGFAHSHSLPQISEGLMGMIDLYILARGNGNEQEFHGKVVAFSSSINSILVPQAFMDWSNNKFAPDDSTQPTRLLMEVTNPADEKVTTYLDKQGYEIESDKLEAEKTTYFLRLIVSIVMCIGIIISVLSFYILMLSIYLLVQKNTKKLQNLLLIGYRTNRVALPYQLLTAGLNLAVLLIAIITVFLLRNYYISIIQALYPEAGNGTMLHTILLGSALFVIVTCLNACIIRNKISKL
ncbi:MAG: ABC transporter permease [Prevotella sp.]|nr:ABC transporter permease [Candidatus Prevotella equi]